MVRDYLGVYRAALTEGFVPHGSIDAAALDR
jgi:hypothetical protein